MPSKYRIILEMASQTARDIASNADRYTDFLITAANNYKYSFKEQLLIHAQKPDATACAEIDTWNKLGRWVNKGTKGIALLIDRDVPYKLRHVFDISDTNSRAGRNITLWQMKPEYEYAVSESLQASFGDVEEPREFPHLLMDISGYAVEDNLSDYLMELNAVKAGSFLEELDDTSLEAWLKTTLKSSVAFMALSRAGYEPRRYFDREDFSHLFDFNTVEVISVLGAAVSDISEMVIREMGETVKEMEKEERRKIRTFAQEGASAYPNMSAWEMSPEERQQLDQETTALSKELNEMLNAKNRIAEIEQEFLQLNPEQHYFEEYYASYSDMPMESLDKLSSQKLLALWMEFEQHAECETRLGLLQKISIMFRFNRNALKLFIRSPEQVIPYLQSQFYSVKRRELEAEKQELHRMLERYAFDAKMEELTQKSLRLFRAELATRYHWRNNRRCFEKNDFRRNSEEFTREYPVVLSTTYSIKGTLSIDHIYDYLIVDEASQVDLATGVLAFSCARNIVIVGDLKQLPNVLTEDDIRTSDAIWQKHSLDERYRFSTHSLLSSALEIWRDAPVTLLREHYRCHPKIINFCNQKFYHGQLIVMTKDHDEPDVLTMYRTIAGNHARGHLNQRQIDVIQQEVLPRLHQQNFQSIGIITPYRDQVTAIRKQLGDTYEVDTVHKFQGREQDAIILTSVDNVITDFVDDPHMLNVAVSRAVHSLTVVTSQDPRNDQTNYGDLTRYIEYNNFEVIQSQVYSVFDMLYQGYAEQRKVYLQKHKRVSEYDSENLMYSVIQEVLSEEAFSTIGCAVHVSLATLVKDYGPLTEEEHKYARNPLTHVDFLLFNQMDKQPVLAIEVDGTGFHEAGSKQAERDIKKNSILKKCAISLLRLRTDGSGEREKIRTALKRK